MKIYIIGDSISIHYGPYLQRELNGVMEYARKEGEAEALLNLDNPMGANGGDSSMVLAFLRSARERKLIQADLLLINCGLHDIKTDPSTGRKQIPLEQYGSNLRAIIGEVQRMRIPLAWIRTTPVDEARHNRLNSEFHRYAADVEAYNRAADCIMREADVPVLDLYAFTCNLGNDLYCDHVHFTEAVREKQAACIAGWLNSRRAAVPGQAAGLCAGGRRRRLERGRSTD